MPTLSDKLKSLGVKVGAKDIQSSRPNDNHSIETVVPGRYLTTPAGEAYVVESLYVSDYRHGDLKLHGLAPLDLVAEWVGDHNIRQIQSDEFVYLDIETTGLTGGTGTYAFLIGVGRFIGEDFHLAQFFMRDPLQEPAQLLALEEFISPCNSVVTYNGKAFDVPILTTRYITQGWTSPFASFSHIDLLPLSRKLWRERMPSRTLGNVETFILGARRTEEDVPGWMIPELFFDYLRSGDARPLKKVFYHNVMDVLAITALLNHISHLLFDPMDPAQIQGVDLIGMGRLYEDLGYTEQAEEYYHKSLDHVLPEDAMWETVKRLSYIKKRRGDNSGAINLWKQAADKTYIYAHVELAKYYEHQARDIENALFWTHRALEIINSPGISPSIHLEWKYDLEHRRERLMNKQALISRR